MDAELRFHLELRDRGETCAAGMSREAAEAAAAPRASGGVEPGQGGRPRRARRGWAVEDLRPGRPLRPAQPAPKPRLHGRGGARRSPSASARTPRSSASSNGVLLRPLPYANGERLVVLRQTRRARRPGRRLGFSVAGDRRLPREQPHARRPRRVPHDVVHSCSGGAEAERVQTGVVSANFFDVLGVPPLLGRTFRPEDEAHGADAVLVLSHELLEQQPRRRPRRRRPGVPDEQPAAHGDRRAAAVPQYPDENDVYMPTSACPFRSRRRRRENRSARMMTAFGRLKPGVTLERGARRPRHGRGRAREREPRRLLPAQARASRASRCRCARS